MKLLKKKTSIITGCNGGIGQAILEKFAQNGSDIIACVRKIDKNFVKKTNLFSKKFKSEIKIFQLDLADENSLKECFKKIENSTKKIDILVNNAGIIENSLFQMTTKKKMMEIYDINFFNTILFTQLVIKKMPKNKNSNIINISSSSAIEGNIGRFIYSSSKAAMNIATKTLVKELSRLGIRVNLISPGLIETKMLKNFTSKEMILKTLKRVALKKLGTAEDVANATVFLASDQSSYINGHNLKVDGGLFEEELF